MEKNHLVILGFDFGLKHIGVAVGQTITQTSTPLLTLAAKAGNPDWQSVNKLIQKWKPHLLIVGIPLNMDGSEQSMTHAARDFKNHLQEKFGLDVYAVDERLSTWEIKYSYPETKYDIARLNAKAAAILIEQWMRDRALQQTQFLS